MRPGGRIRRPDNFNHHPAEFVPHVENCTRRTPAGRSRHIHQVLCALVLASLSDWVRVEVHQSVEMHEPSGDGENQYPDCVPALAISSFIGMRNAGLERVETPRNIQHEMLGILTTS